MPGGVFGPQERRLISALGCGVKGGAGVGGLASGRRVGDSSSESDGVPGEASVGLSDTPTK